MNNDRPSKISLKDVNRRFYDGFELKTININVRNGEAFVLIGPSASGKTVILKMIAGLFRPDAGSIRINGQETVDLDIRARDIVARMGVLFQRSALFDSLTVWENITFRSAHTGKLKQAAAIEFATLKLRSVGLDADTAFLYPSELSGGMQKRVALARALADDPEILLLDEPTAGLDPVMSSLIIDRLLFNLADLGATAIMVTSNLKGARAVANEIGMLRNGLLVWSGTPDDLDHTDDPFMNRFLHGTRQKTDYLSPSGKLD